MTERFTRPPEGTPAIIMPGDNIIANPEVAWDTTIVVPRPPHIVWEGQFGLARMGLVEEGYAGLAFPPRYDLLLPPQFQSLPKGAPLPRKLAVGDAIPDGHGEDRAVVCHMDDEGPEKIIVFDAQWGPKKKGKNKGRDGLHYTWQIHARAGEKPDETVITTRTHMENLTHRRLTAAFGPSLDRMAMRMIKEGLERDDVDPRTTPGWVEKYGRVVGRGIIGAAAGAIAVRRALRKYK